MIKAIPGEWKRRCGYFRSQSRRSGFRPTKVWGESPTYKTSQHSIKAITWITLLFFLVVMPEIVVCDEPGPVPIILESEVETRPADSLVDRRLADEKKTNDSPFVLTPHRLNYLMPLTYNSSPNTGVYKGTDAEDIDLDRVEAKFQISIKYMLLNNLLDKHVDVYLAYSALSFWQAYNKDLSSPFRDTNYEPEAWVQWNMDSDILGIRAKLLQVGIWHQSNGRVEPISRSWNRVYANIIFEKGRWVLGIKPWYRLHEDQEDDNNPDIETYYGHGEIHMAYKKERHTVSLMLRNNGRTSRNRGALELGWSFPVHGKLKGYLQYFNGYGQTILDYNHSSNTIGIGIELADIL